MAKSKNTLIEFWGFLRHRKRFWLFPIVLILLFVGSMIIVAESSSIAPFLYAIF